MAKSIRSKIKRKARAEFRNTIGTVAYNENMKKVQEKLKECVGAEIKSLDRLSEQLDTGATSGMEEEDVMKVPVEASAVDPALLVKGENKVPGKRKSKTKHRLKSAEKKQVEKMPVEKKRPRFFCQF